MFQPLKMSRNKAKGLNARRIQAESRMLHRRLLSWATKETDSTNEQRFLRVGYSSPLPPRRPAPSGDGSLFECGALTQDRKCRAETRLR